MNEARVREQIKWGAIDALRRRVFIPVGRCGNQSENAWIWSRIGAPIREQVREQAVHPVWNPAHHRVRKAREGIKR